LQEFPGRAFDCFVCLAALVLAQIFTIADAAFHDANRELNLSLPAWAFRCRVRMRTGARTQ
jgi:hypothetical protein